MDEIRFGVERHTFTILAKCPRTGALGIAIATYSLGVGGYCNAQSVGARALGQYRECVSFYAKTDFVHLQTSLRANLGVANWRHLHGSPLNRGAFLVPSTPPIGKLPGWGTGDGSGGCGSPTHGPSGSSSATLNLAWNFGRGSLAL